MPTKTEGNYLGDLIVREFDENFNRDRRVAEGAVAFGELVKGGTSPTTQLAPCAAGDAASVLGISLGAVATTEAVVALVRGPAIVKESAIVYPSGATTNQKAAFRTQLQVLGIRVETSNV